MLPMVLGIVPTNEFSFKNNIRKLIKDPIAVGRVPVIEVEISDSSFRDTIFPMSGEMVEGENEFE
jgi:hypothetical protein